MGAYKRYLESLELGESQGLLHRQDLRNQNKKEPIQSSYPKKSGWRVSGACRDGPAIVKNSFMSREIYDWERPIGPIAGGFSINIDVLQVCSTESLASVRFCVWLGILVTIGVSLSLVLSLWWAISHADMSGGFTLGSYIIAAFAFPIGVVGYRHSSDCRCWTRAAEIFPMETPERLEALYEMDALNGATTGVRP